MEGDGEVKEADTADARVWVNLPGFVTLKTGEEEEIVSDYGE